MKPLYLIRDHRNSGNALKRENTIASIKYAVAYFFGMPVELLHHRNTTRAVTVPRQIAMYLVKQMTNASLPEIGRQFGGKHHSTVLHSIAKIEGRRNTDVGMDLAISTLVEHIRGQADRPRVSRSVQ